MTFRALKNRLLPMVLLLVVTTLPPALHAQDNLLLRTVDSILEGSSGNPGMPEGVLYEKLGNISAGLGRFTLAMTYYENAFNRYRSFTVAEPLNLPRICCELGLFYREWGMSGRASGFFRQCLASMPVGELSGQDAVSAFLFQGISWMNLGEPLRALHAFSEVETRSRAVQTPIVQLQLLAMTGRARCLDSLNLTDSALTVYRMVRESIRFSEGFSIDDQARLLLELSRACSTVSRFDEALGYCNEGLSFLTDSPVGFRARLLRIELLALQSEILDAEGSSGNRVDPDGAGALQAILTAMQETEALLSDYPGSESLVLLAQRTEKAAELSLDLLFRQPRARREDIVQVLQTAASLARLRATQLEVREVLVSQEGFIMPLQGPPAEPGKMDSCMRELLLAARHQPPGNTGRSGPPRVFSENELRRSVQPGEALIIYYVGHKSLYSLLVKSDTVVVLRQPVSISFRSDLEALTASMSGADNLRFRGLSRILELALFEPHMINLNGIGRIHLILPPELSDIPFEALIRPSPDGSPRFLVREFEMIYHLSMPGYVAGRGEDSPSPQVKAFSGFAADNYSDRYGFPLYSTLTSSSEEVRAIAAVMKKNGYEVTAITASGSIQTEVMRALRQNGIVHFSTHCRVDAELSRSGILFPADTASVSPDEEGILTVDEIRRMRCTAALVVLNGCSTGKTVPTNLDGLQSVATAFLAAGAVQTVSSLWSVPDRPARDFMVRFYSELVKGKSPSAALQAVKIRMVELKNQISPYTWAGYIVTER